MATAYLTTTTADRLPTCGGTAPRAGRLLCCCIDHWLGRQHGTDSLLLRTVDARANPELGQAVREAGAQPVEGLTGGIYTIIVLGRREGAELH